MHVACDKITPLRKMHDADCTWKGCYIMNQLNLQIDVKFRLSAAGGSALTQSF